MRLLLGLVAVLGTTPAFAGRQAWVTSNHIQVVDLDAGRVVGRIAAQEFIHDLVFLPGGATALVASSKGLRVADAERLEFREHLLTAATIGVAVSAGGTRAVAISDLSNEEGKAARRAKQPLASTVTVLGLPDLAVQASFAVEDRALDVAISNDGQQIFVLIPNLGRVDVFSPKGALLESLDVASHLPKNSVGQPDAFLSRMGLSPDGSTLAVPVTTAGFSAILDIDLMGRRPLAERVRQDDLGHARRIHGFAWDDDGASIHVSAVSSLVKWNGHGLPVAWRADPHTYVDIAPVTASAETVVVAPTWNSERNSGGVCLLDGQGNLVRAVELPDMSPFRVVVRP